MAKRPKAPLWAGPPRNCLSPVCLRGSESLRRCEVIFYALASISCLRADAGLMYQISEHAGSVRPGQLGGLVCFHEAGRRTERSRGTHHRFTSPRRSKSRPSWRFLHHLSCDPVYLDYPTLGQFIQYRHTSSCMFSVF